MIQQTIYGLLGGATALLGLVVIFQNWLLVARAYRGTGSGSPVLGAGPLMLLVSGGSLARAFPADLAGWWWVLGALGLVLDPAAVPLVVWAVYSKYKGSDENSRSRPE